MSLERLAFWSLLLLAVSLGLGDIAQVTPVGTVLLVGVRGLLVVAIGLALLSSLLRRRRPAFPRSIALPAAAWLAVQVVSAVLAPSNRLEALASLERPASGALLAWAVYEACRADMAWRLLARAVALGGLGIALVGLAEAARLTPVLDFLATLHDGSVPIGDVPRIASTLSHPNLAAVLLELSLPLLVAWLWAASGPWRLPLALGTVSTVIALVLTFSRAGIVSGVAALAVMASLCVSRADRRHLAQLAAVALVVPLALICVALTDPGIDRRLTAGLDESRYGQPSRLEFWSVALDMERDHPWLGLGPDNYRWQFVRYSGVSADNLGVHAHDQYLEALADTGVLGVLTLAWLLLGLARNALRSVPADTSSPDWAWRAALLASLSAWLFHAVLDDFERFWPASVAFWLIAGLSLRLPEAQGAQRSQQALGRVALGHEPRRARPQGVVPLLGSTTQRQHPTAGVDGAQAIKLTVRSQTRQIPVQHDHARPRVRHLVDQLVGRRAGADD